MIRAVLIGAGGHARVVRFAAESTGRVRVVGVIADSEPPGSTWHGVPVLDEAELLAGRVPEPLAGALLGVGDNAARQRLATRILDADLPLLSAVHASAVIAPDATVGEGSVVMAGAVVHPGAVLGRGSLVNTRASVDHDCVLGDWSSIGPGATLGGSVRLGEGAIVAIGATVLHGRSVGEHALVAAGAVVTKDVPPFAIVAGVPARMVRRREPGDSYL